MAHLGLSRQKQNKKKVTVILMYMTIMIGRLVYYWNAQTAVNCIKWCPTLNVSLHPFRR